MLGSSCFPCCQPQGEETFGLAFRGWSGQFHEINYSSYLVGEPSQEPALQEDGSRLWFAAPATAAPRPTVLGTFFTPATSVDVRMRDIQVRTEHDQQHVRCLVRLENVHNYVDIVYQKPLAFMPSYNAIGVHRFTAEDVQSYEYTEKDGVDVDGLVRVLNSDAPGFVIPLERPDFSVGDFGEVTLVLKDLQNVDNGFMPPGSTLSASTTLPDLTSNATTVNPEGETASLAYTNTPIAVQVPEDGVATFQIYPSPTLFLSRISADNSGNAPYSRTAYFNAYPEEGPFSSLYVGGIVWFVVTRLLWEAYSENNSLTLSLTPNLYMPFPGLYIPSTAGFPLGVPKLFSNTSSLVPFSVTFAVS